MKKTKHPSFALNDNIILLWKFKCLCIKWIKININCKVFSNCILKMQKNYKACKIDDIHILFQFNLNYRADILFIK